MQKILPPARLLLLTGSTEAAVLAPHLSQHNPECAIAPAETLAALERALDRGDPARTRLVAFCTAVIVPARILDRLGGGAYNFHPGPPTYPGRYPACWGSYEGATRFGATLHEMRARVDEGPIVAVEWFDVTPPIGHDALSERALRATVDLFRRYAPRLVAEAALPTDARLAWSGRKWRLSDYEAMCRLPPDIDAAEFARRRRAFAEMPDARLTIELHGTCFTWQALAESDRC
ncbi:MAG TPA: formyltransferase family protein [Stellaceae bacterium]|nr:formyltransferase family protein [Stellaceae bacterium]